MSCNGESSFGYVTIEDDKVVVYIGDSNNPEVHKFCNDDLIQAMKLLDLTRNRIEELKNFNGLSEDYPFHKEYGTKDLREEFQKLMEESKK